MLGAEGTWGRRGCRAFSDTGVFTALSGLDSGRAAPVAYAHATPPTRCPPGPRVLPPTPPPTDTPLHPLFSSSGSSFSSSLSPVQCELGLGRIHWQTLRLDLLSFISHNQRMKGRLAKGRARDHRAHVLQKVLPTRTHTHTHTHTHTPSGAGTSPTYLHFHSRSVQREPIFSQHFARTFVPEGTTFIRSGHTLLVPVVKEAGTLLQQTRARTLPSFYFSRWWGLLSPTPLPPPAACRGSGLPARVKAPSPAR